MNNDIGTIETEQNYRYDNVRVLVRLRDFSEVDSVSSKEPPGLGFHEVTAILPRLHDFPYCVPLLSGGVLDPDLVV